MLILILFLLKVKKFIEKNVKDFRETKNKIELIVCWE